MSRKSRRKQEKLIPDGVHFLNGPRQLRDLMSPESLQKDGRGGRVEPAPAVQSRSMQKRIAIMRGEPMPTRFGPKP